MMTTTARQFPPHCRRARLSPTAPGIHLDCRDGLDCLVEVGPRGGVHRWWRRSDRRESADRMVSTWDSTQRDAHAR